MKDVGKLDVMISEDGAKVVTRTGETICSIDRDTDSLTAVLSVLDGLECDYEEHENF